MRIRIIVLFLLLGGIGFSQQITIHGEVRSLRGDLLDGVGIYENNTLKVITNEKGRYQFSTEFKDSIPINIRSLGYESKSISLNPQKKIKSYSFDFTLIENDVILQAVKIEAKSINGFNISEWLVLDLKIKDNILLVLAKVSNDNYLFTFTLKGKLLSKIKVENQFRFIKISCLGGLHLIGNKDCIEFSISKNTVKFNERYSAIKFENLLSKCSLSYKTNLIFNTYTNHNKQLFYYYFDKNTNKQTDIYTVFDENGAKFADSQINKIISEYSKAISSPDKNDITKGGSPIDIVKAGEWDGDLIALMINNELVKLIGFYKFVLSKPVKSQIIKIKDGLYIFDFTNNSVIQINLNGTILKRYNVNFKRYKNPKILEDKKNQNQYLFCNEDEIYKINVNNFTFKLIHKINDSFRFIDKVTIFNSYIYFRTYDTTKNYYNKINKIRL